MKKYANILRLKIFFYLLGCAWSWPFDVGHFSHEMDVIHRKSISVDATIEKVDHGIDPSFYDLGVLGEIVGCVEEVAGVDSSLAARSAVMQDDVT